MGNGQRARPARRWGPSSGPTASRSSGRRARRSSSGSSTTCTAQPVSPLFFDIGGWWLTCDHMFRRFGTPFASDWIAKNVNGYVYTAAVPADSSIRAEATEYEARLHPRVPRDPGYAGKIGAYLGWVLPSYAENFLDWWRDRLRPELERNFERLDTYDTESAEPARPRDPARGRDRHPRPRVEDPLDAQLRPVLLDDGAERDDRGGPRRGRPGAHGPAPVVRRGPQLGLRRGPLEDEGGDPGRRRAPRDIRGRRDRGRHPRGLEGSERGQRFVAERLRAAPAGLRLQGDLVARVRLQDVGRGPRADHRGGARLPRDGLRLPGEHQGGRRRPRGSQGRGHGGRRGRGTREAPAGARPLRWA